MLALFCSARVWPRRPHHDLCFVELSDLAARRRRRPEPDADAQQLNLSLFLFPLLAALDTVFWIIAPRA
jgi:hypothetical protein